MSIRGDVSPSPCISLISHVPFHRRVGVHRLSISLYQGIFTMLFPDKESRVI